MPLDLPGRRAALRILHESGRLARRGDLARYAVAAVHGRRDRIPAGDAADPTVAAFLLGDYTAAVSCSPGKPMPPRPRPARVGCAAARAGPAAGSRSVISPRCGRTRAHPSAGRAAVGLALGWQLLHHQGAEDALAMALDEGWPERMAGFAPWTAQVPTSTGAWRVSPVSRLGSRRAWAMPRPPFPCSPVPSGRWAWRRHGRRTTRARRARRPRRSGCSTAATTSRSSSARCGKALPADFRFPMTDARLALARLCALGSRTDEARQWFDAARTGASTPRAREPLRAVVDHDKALMHLGPTTWPRQRRTSPPRGRPSTSSE
jgi:hypothetical protein